MVDVRLNIALREGLPPRHLPSGHAREMMRGHRYSCTTARSEPSPSGTDSLGSRRQ